LTELRAGLSCRVVAPQHVPIQQGAPASNPPDIAIASIPDTLAALRVDPATGLTRAEVDTRRKDHGYNEVAELRGHPVRTFLARFWGISACR
jgi:magnesium-transporting ATPase (P-type)